MSNTSFERVFEPGQIGGMSIKNRLVMPAMGTRYSDNQGYVTERLKRYHHERALGGVGLIITEITAVRFAGRNRLTIAHDKYLPGLAQLAQVIHQGGARAAVQLWHPGRQSTSADTGSQPVAPSAIPSPGGEMPRELAADEIRDLVGDFADASVRAQRAGFDGVEIHGAHGYLIAQFLSSATNQRGDEYGGSLENRARFLLEIIQAIRMAVGPNYPMWCRLNGQEYGIHDGLDISETRQVAQMAEAAGVDAIHVSASGTVAQGSATLPVTPGILISLAAQIKRSVKVPVIAVGRLDPELGDRILREGQADFIAIGRRLIADARLPDKALSGEGHDVNPCIACNECIDNVLAGNGLGCAVNPGVGTDHENTYLPVAQAKKVVVIGGGPAGMEAATIASLRGHDVTLFESSSKLGGQLNLAKLPPGKEALGELVDYLALQVEKAGVHVELDLEATLEHLIEVNPDVAVFATGTLPYKSEYGGIERPDIVSAEDVLLERSPAGQRVVVIGGGMVGCEVARHLTNKGSRVTVIEQLDVIAPKMSRTARSRLLNLLHSEGVNMITNAMCDEIRIGEVIISSGNADRRRIEADTVVLATGLESNESLFKAAQGRIPEIHLIGDASQPRNLADALRDGFRVGHSI